MGIRASRAIQAVFDIFQPFIMVYKFICLTILAVTPSVLGRGGYMEEFCGTGPESLECPSGTYPRIFRQKTCGEINDGDIVPYYKDLYNPCKGQMDGVLVAEKSCFVCTKNTNDRQLWRVAYAVAKNGNEVDLELDHIP